MLDRLAGVQFAAFGLDIMCLIDPLLVLRPTPWFPRISILRERQRSARQSRHAPTKETGRQHHQNALGQLARPWHGCQREIPRRRAMLRNDAFQAWEQIFGRDTDHAVVFETSASRGRRSFTSPNPRRHPRTQSYIRHGSTSRTDDSGRAHQRSRIVSLFG